MAFSAFPNLPGDTGSTVGRGSGMLNGQNLGFSVVPSGNTVIVKDLFETLASIISYPVSHI